MRTQGINLIVGIIYFLISFGCTPDPDEQSDIENEEDALYCSDCTKTGNAENDTVKGLTNETPYYSDQINVLDMATAQFPELNHRLHNYQQLIFNSSKITTEDQIREVFKYRDTLIVKLIPILEELFLQAQTQDNNQLWDNAVKELTLLGIQPVYAEGSLIGITFDTVLDETIERVASKEFQLYIAFDNAYAGSMDGEYPFLDLSEQMEMLRIGEKLLREYPEGAYSKIVEARFFKALRMMTDVHKVIDERHSESYCVYDTYTDYFPYVTDITNHKKFAEEYLDSRFSVVVGKILQNISEIHINNNGEYENLYLVEIDRFIDVNKAEKAVRNYLKNGIDVPHFFSVLGELPEEYSVVYRFYSDSSKAAKALHKIRRIFNNARIVKINANHAILAN